MPSACFQHLVGREVAAWSLSLPTDLDKINQVAGLKCHEIRDVGLLQSLFTIVLLGFLKNVAGNPASSLSLSVYCLVVMRPSTYIEMYNSTLRCTTASIALLENRSSSSVLRHCSSSCHPCFLSSLCSSQRFHHKRTVLVSSFASLL